MQGDGIVSCMVREEEETTTGAEVVTGDVVVGVITVAVIWEGAVVTTETVAGVDKEEVTAEQQLSVRPWLPGTGQRAGDFSPFEKGHGGVASLLQKVAEGTWDWDEGHWVDRVCKRRPW